MDVKISPALEAVIREKVDSGRYLDVEAVIEEALRLLQERDNLDELRAKIQRGFDQIERGEGIVLTPAVYEQILENARRKLREGRQPNADVLP